MYCFACDATEVTKTTCKTVETKTKCKTDLERDYETESTPESKTEESD